MWDTLCLEIIFEIFGHFLPGLKLSIDEPHQFPWYLGQVCMTWRNAFLAFPLLWNIFDIDLGIKNLDHTTFERRLAMLEESLLRSGSHTISFRFTVDWHRHSLSPLFSQFCGQILDRLVAQSTRWRDAYFRLGIPEAEILYRVKNRLPMLRSLQCIFVPSNMEITQNFNDLLTDAPRLTRVCLDDRILKWTVDWSSITSVLFDMIPEVRYLSCLKQARRLEELAFRCRVYGRNMDLNVRPIALPSLKVLDVCHLDLLLLFETPALEALYTSFCTDSSWIASSYIGSLRHIKKLSICACNAVELKQLIRCLPAAQDLHVRCSDPDLLKLLLVCEKAYGVRMLTFTLLLGYLGQPTEYLPRIITSWKKQRDMFGPFNSLTKITIVFLKHNPQHIPETIAPHLDSLKHHFEDQGIQCSIQQRDIFGAYTSRILPFDTL